MLEIVRTLSKIHVLAKDLSRSERTERIERIPECSEMLNFLRETNRRFPEHSESVEQTISDLEAKLQSLAHAEAERLTR